MIIAVDGPAASGKGTLARRLARHYGYAYLDTGALYRAVARDVIQAGGDPEDAEFAAARARRLDPNSLDDPGLRAQGIGRGASIVAKIPAVREALLVYQREFAKNAPGAVLDGRDIGTVVCPDAAVKLYVDASPEVRAERRYRELQKDDPDIDLDDVLADIRTRDERDAGRDTAPLKRAGDAHLLVTTNLDIERTYRKAVALIDATIGSAGDV